MNPINPAPLATVDAQNPWLGLVSFTEETRNYFHGRDEEAAELGRRVQRKLLTVLFGQSGLGKTSILQAGLVPRLRPEGFCPVYVRLDYDPHSPSPAEQIKRAVFSATEAAGTWTKTGVAVSGETLWEFLHHRDDVLKDASGRTLTLILIFDQFEEIFTLAQSDDAGRRRAQEFLTELADLVENRPPAALESRIDREETDAATYDFARADYRILISLREDYLAHLEGLKVRMPSVTQNRMRLARMSGSQAVAAVRAPAPHLVSEAVAESVVRFVAGGADLDRAEVETSLLSLICRELNNTRIARGHAEISADLLAGSRDTILAEFYERVLADQPPGVRVFIEDEMLTDSGFRESVAEERVRKGFVAAGAKPGALALLVDRRLLRVEDRLDLRRVEITHDVLCGVIGASRSARREREALEESRRQLAVEQAREAATRLSLVRARFVAAVAIVVMLLAAGSAVFGWINLRRARYAGHLAQQATVAETRLREQAQAQELAARQRAYASDMNVALEALRGSNLGRAIDLMNRERPQPGQADLRGWEWRYLWQQTHSDALATLYEGRYGEISSLAVSPDGRWLAAGMYLRGGLVVLDLQTHSQVAVCAPADRLVRAVFSPTDPLLAFASSSLHSADGSLSATLHLWNAATRRMVAELPLDGTCGGLAFSRDGQRLVTLTKEHVTLWQMPGAIRLASFPSEAFVFGVAINFAAAPDLGVAAYAMAGGQVRVVDLSDGRELWRATVSKQYVTALAFSPDGKTLATAAGFSESGIRLWDVASGAEIGRLEGHKSWVCSIVYWPDGKKLASSSADQTIRTWDLASRRCLDVMRGSRNEVWRLALLPDGRTLASGNKDGVVSLWDASIAHPRAEYVMLGEKTYAWHFSADGASIVALKLDGEVTRWSGADFQTKKVLLRTNLVQGLSTSGLASFSSDGRYLMANAVDGSIGVWDLSRRAWVGRLKPATKDEFGIAILDDGNRLFTRSDAHNRDHEWDLSTNREIQSWQSAVWVFAGGISPDERLIVELGFGGDIVSRDLPDRHSSKPPLDILEPSGAGFSLDGKFFAATSQLGYVRVWDTAAWREAATLRGFRLGAAGVNFSPDAKRLVAGAGSGDEALKLWDTSGWQQVFTLPAEGSLFNSVSFSPDGNTLGACNAEGQLILWHAPTWAEIEAAEKPAAGTSAGNESGPSGLVGR